MKFQKGHKGYWKDKKLSEKTRRKLSISHKGLLSGDKHHNWKGGFREITPYGYIRIWNPNHPNAVKGGRILEHRLVMSNYLDRSLKKGEYVHHRNGNRQDNRIENLELVTGKNHRGELVCPYCQKSFW